MEVGTHAVDTHGTQLQSRELAMPSANSETSQNDEPRQSQGHGHEHDMLTEGNPKDNPREANSETRQFATPFRTLKR